MLLVQACSWNKSFHGVTSKIFLYFQHVSSDDPRKFSPGSSGTLLSSLETTKHFRRFQELQHARSVGDATLRPRNAPSKLRNCLGICDPAYRSPILRLVSRARRTVVRSGHSYRGSVRVSFVADFCCPLQRTESRLVERVPIEV